MSHESDIAAAAERNYANTFAGSTPGSAYGTNTWGDFDFGQSGGEPKSFDGKATTAGAAFGPWGAVAGAAVDLYRGYADRRRYQRHLNRARRRGEAVISNFIEPTTRKQYAKAGQQFEQIPGIVKKGYESARSQVGQTFRGAARQAVESGQKTLGRAQADLASQGVVTSSVYANLRMGMGAHTSRLLQDMYDNFARIDAELTVGGANAEAGARAQLGSFYEREHDAIQIVNQLKLQLATMR